MQSGSCKTKTCFQNAYGQRFLWACCSGYVTLALVVQSSSSTWAVCAKPRLLALTVRSCAYCKLTNYVTKMTSQNRLVFSPCHTTLTTLLPPCSQQGALTKVRYDSVEVRPLEDLRFIYGFCKSFLFTSKCFNVLFHRSPSIACTCAPDHQIVRRNLVHFFHSSTIHFFPHFYVN